MEVHHDSRHACNVLFIRSRSFASVSQGQARLVRNAIVFGALLPVVETIRRWGQLDELRYWPFWIDDLLLGALLLYAAWRVSENRAKGGRFLVAAWGVTCGMAYPSFFNQLMSLDRPDPAPIPSAWVAAIKGVGFALAIVALVGSFRQDAADKRLEAT
jgi:hypothetical protein